MKKIDGWDQINEAGEFKRLPAGIYGVRITNVVDNPVKEYFEVFVDIVKGEFANYFKNQLLQTGKDNSRTIRSYTSKALPFFKAFITSVEKSNVGYQWDWDEKKLVGKNVIAVFGEEEYKDADGNIKVAVKIQEFRSLEAYKEGKIKVPEIKRLPESERPVAQNTTTDSNGVTSISDDDLPF